jgi:hypothetical protein
VRGRPAPRRGAGGRPARRRPARPRVVQQRQAAQSQGSSTACTPQSAAGRRRGVVVAAHQHQSELGGACRQRLHGRQRGAACGACAECSRSPRKTCVAAPWRPPAPSAAPACRRWWPRAPARPGGGTTPPCRCGRRPPAACAVLGQEGGALRQQPQPLPARSQRSARQAPRQAARRCSGVEVFGGQALEARAGIALQPADDQRGDRRGHRIGVDGGRGRAVGFGRRRAGSGAAAIRRGRRTGSCARSGARARTPARRRPSRASCPGSSRRTAAASARCAAPAAPDSRARRSG